MLPYPPIYSISHTELYCKCFLQKVRNNFNYQKTFKKYQNNCEKTLTRAKRCDTMSVQIKKRRTKTMKHYGSAVLTALQAQYKSLEEVGELVRHRKLKAFVDGGQPEEWLDEFWHTMAFLVAQSVTQKVGV